jgi:hypothetical protein
LPQLSYSLFLPLPTKPVKKKQLKKRSSVKQRKRFSSKQFAKKLKYMTKENLFVPPLTKEQKEDLLVSTEWFRATKCGQDMMKALRTQALATLGVEGVKELIKAQVPTPEAGNANEV